MPFRAQVVNTGCAPSWSFRPMANEIKSEMLESD